MKFIKIVATLIASLYLSSAMACGAIAFNTSTNQWGRASGYSNLSDAMNAAIQSCGPGCGIFAWTCGPQVSALVYGYGGSYATAVGFDPYNAINNARMSCPSCDGYVTVGN